MKKFFARKPFLFPGYGQLTYGKKMRGWVLTLAFWDCVLVGLLFLLWINHPLSFPIGFLCEVLSGLLWIYSYLDYLDLTATLPKLKKVSADLDEDEEEPTQEKVSDYYESGRIYYLNGEFQAAQKDFEKALKVNKEDWDAIYQLGRLHFDLGEKKKAKKYFERYQNAKDSTKWNKETETYLKKLSHN